MNPTARGYSELAKCVSPFMAEIAALPKPEYRTNRPETQVTEVAVRDPPLEQTS